MVSLAYSASAPSYNDPVFVRTHFLGRVASDGSGLEYQHELLKRRSSRHSDFNRWSANWITPVTHTMDYDSDDTSDTDDDAFDRDAQSGNAKSNQSTSHLRCRSSTLPLSSVSSVTPVEMARARSMTAPASSSSAPSETRTPRKNRSTVGTETRLMPARPLSINTAQPLRMPSPNVADVSSEQSLSIDMPSPMAAVGPSPKTCSPPVVRIESSESDGSCHGDAGDQDPEAQLAAGIIRLREQRRSASSPKGQRRPGSKRRPSVQSLRSVSAAQPKVLDDADSDDAQSRIIRNHGGNFVLRLAEMVLDFGSSALEKLVVSSSHDTPDQTFEASLASPLEPRRRSSTTPKQLSAEAGELLRRRRERTGSVIANDSASDKDNLGKAVLTRSWSVPKLLTLPLFNPSASLRALSSSTASTPSTPFTAPAHLHPNFGFTTISVEPEAYEAYEQLNSFDDVAACFNQQSATIGSHAATIGEAAVDFRAVSPLWKQ